MKVFVFDLLPYARHFDEFKADRHIPYPLPRRFHSPEVTARGYEAHLEIWKEMDRLGYDGVGLNEHHTTPHGMIAAPNMMAAVGAQHTKNLKFFILGELLPLHNPVRIAEELAMADCMSRGRIWPGFARGNPREYRAYNIPMSESRSRFEEAFDIIQKAWTEEVFSHEGRHWTFKDVAIWPRPYQQPLPPMWVPFAGSKETIEWAGRKNAHAVIPENKRGLIEDIVTYYAKCLADNGHQITPDHLCLFTEAFVADSKAQALAEYGSYYLYFNQTLWHHGGLLQSGSSAGPRPVGPPPDHIRPENRSAAVFDRAKIRDITQESMEQKLNAGDLVWGAADEVADRLIEAAEHTGSNVLLLTLSHGALPSEMFMEQVRRFGRDVLPKLQAHEVKRVPLRAQAA